MRLQYFQSRNFHHSINIDIESCFTIGKCNLRRKTVRGSMTRRKYSRDYTKYHLAVQRNVIFQKKGKKTCDISH